MIRKYDEKDFEGIIKIIQSNQNDECWLNYYPNGWEVNKIKEEFEPLNRYNNPIFLVSEINKELTGLIAGHDLEPFIENEIPHLKDLFDEFKLSGNSSFYQRDLIVHKNNQKGTSAIRLFNALREHAIKNNKANIVTRTPSLNLEGIDFFEKLGYKEIFRDKNPERIYFAKKV